MADSFPHFPLEIGFVIYSGNFSILAVAGDVFPHWYKWSKPIPKKEFC
jgi:hypothetical protein